MVHSNKVLTVSYGTFSCTLEGFEESFDTMKAIAEYFRDLAADDRYFGAEPPQPDADMLARIAQHEASRQIEAMQSETGIVLRAAQTTEQAAELSPEPEPKQGLDQNVDPDASQVSEHRSETADLTDVAHDVVAVDSAADLTAEVGDGVVDDMPTAPSDQAAEQPNTQHTALVAPAQDSADTDQDQPDKVVTSTEDPDVDIPASPVVAEIIDPAPAVNDDNSIAAKLQRIRAVVARNDAAVEDAEFVEDQHAETVEDEDSLKVAESLDLVDPTVTDADISSLFEDLEDEVEDTDLGLKQPVADISAPNADQDTDLTLSQTDPAQVGTDTDDDIIENILTDTVQDVVTDKPDAPLRPAHKVRVKKVKRADVDAALAEGALEEVDPAVDPNPQAEDQGQTKDGVMSDPAVADQGARSSGSDSTLSKEDEEDLRRELAMVEAEFAPESSAAHKPDTTRTDREVSEQTDAADEDAMSRLMDAADARLDDPETSTKTEAYSHLRAAVAAAQAERDSGNDVASEPADDAYRADLAQVVKPRRPTATGIARPRPADGDAKPAPLKLVAEQRIDEPVLSGPIVPRRVSTAFDDANPADVDQDFVQYVQEVEAETLPEKLEAAAAYMSFVEGREHFTRPQLMNKIRSVHSDEFNREDGLRAFGKLLRNGKLVKAGGGRFTASPDHHPANQHAARMAK